MTRVALADSLAWNGVACLCGRFARLRSMRWLVFDWFEDGLYWTPFRNHLLIRDGSEIFHTPNLERKCIPIRECACACACVCLCLTDRYFTTEAFSRSHNLAPKQINKYCFNRHLTNEIMWCAMSVRWPLVADGQWLVDYKYAHHGHPYLYGVF